ncbi:hypothetical protein ANN_06244 [Periplaneta americana]|uniref:Uncharacterized protein n=1 Tax=Periplaneta americana TaxID=6978 RepID=A0ABQ8TFA8_PERAM|nr:hypothetical protein ANN_06244 [Periplaneta americana]
MAGLCEGGNEPPGSLKAICNCRGDSVTVSHTIQTNFEGTCVRNQKCTEKQQSVVVWDSARSSSRCLYCPLDATLDLPETRPGS